MLRRVWMPAAFAGMLAVSQAIAQEPAIRFPGAPTKIEIQSTVIDSFDLRDASRQRFGTLEFRGGLDMRSAHRAFGGISGLRMRPDGENFLAVTDNGSWLRGRIAYVNGRPSGIVDAEMAPLIGGDGKPLSSRGWFDVESIVQDGGTVFVGVERVDRIVRYDFGRDGLLARGEPIELPPDFKGLKFNKSLECLALMPKAMPRGGSLIAVTENSLDGQGNIRSFVLSSPDVVRFSVRKYDDYEVSDCTILPPSNLLLLERRYSRARGVGIRLRTIALSALKDGALADGPVLMEADMGYQIDNLEGVGIHRNAQGETILTLVSDDNFSPIQRNLLLQFAIVGP